MNDHELQPASGELILSMRLSRAIRLCARLAGQDEATWLDAAVQAQARADEAERRQADRRRPTKPLPF